MDKSRDNETGTTRQGIAVESRFYVLVTSFNPTRNLAITEHMRMPDTAKLGTYMLLHNEAKIT